MKVALGQGQCTGIGPVSDDIQVHVFVHGHVLERFLIQRGVEDALLLPAGGLGYAGLACR